MLFLFLTPPLSHAAQITGNSTTIFKMYDETFVDDDISHARLQEYFTLSIDSLPVEGLSFYTNGHLSFEADEGFESDAFDSWLNIIYLDWLDSDYRKNIRAGRQFIYMGVTNEIIDGVFGRYSNSNGMGIGLYAGTTVDGSTGGFQGNNTAGTRLHYNMDRQKEIGLSYAIESDNSDPAKENIGVDGFYNVNENLEFYGHLYYDLIAEDLYDLELYTLYQHSQRLTVSVDYNHTVPSLLLDKTSIFWVFSVDRQRDIGIDIDYDLTAFTTINGHYRYYNYEDGDSANSYGIGAKLRYGAGAGHYAIGKINRYDDVVGGYYELQLLNRYNLKKKLSLANDILLVLLDNKTLDSDYSFSMGGDIRYAAAKKLALEFGIDYRSTPFFDSEIRGTFKVLYNFSFDTARTKN
jgi:hypothetical protein